MSGSASSSQPLLNANAPHDHDRYHEADKQDHDIEASLDSFEDDDIAIYPLRANSPLPYNEKRTERGRQMHRDRSGLSSGNRKRYATIALILIFLVAFAMFAIVHVSSTDETHAEIIPEGNVKTDEPEVGSDASEQAPAFSPQLLGRPAESFWDNLRNDTLYLTGWVNAGWTNDFMTIINMLYVALLANRTGVIPPFEPSHVGQSAGLPPFSEVFDVPRLSSLIRLPLVEWYDLKDRNSTHIDELGCWSAWATPRPDFGPRGGPIPPRIHVDASYTPVPRHAKLVESQPQELHVRFDVLAALTYPEGRRDARLPAEAPYPGANGHKKLPDEHIACFDFLYYGASVYGYEMFHDFSPSWSFVGTHAHWNPRILELAEPLLAAAFDVPLGSPIPPFISAHIRHGDFALACQNDPNANHTDPLKDCFAPLSEYSDKIEEVKAELRAKRGIEVERVLVTSDEKNAEWWMEVRSLGWTWLDHKESQTADKYGKWYPVFIDAAAQSLGAGFVGTYRSTMSLMAARRVVDWNGGASREVNWVPHRHRGRRGASLDEWLYEFAI